MIAGWVTSLLSLCERTCKGILSSGMIEQLSTELEEEGFFFALGEDISTLVLAADPNGHGYLVEELVTAIHDT